VWILSFSKLHDSVQYFSRRVFVNFALTVIYRAFCNLILVGIYACPWLYYLLEQDHVGPNESVSLPSVYLSPLKFGPCSVIFFLSTQTTFSTPIRLHCPFWQVLRFFNFRLSPVRLHCPFWQVLRSFFNAKHISTLSRPSTLPISASSLFL